MNISDLPSDLFHLIIIFLSPSDLIVIRRVSKAFNTAFSSQELNHLQITHHFPESREVKASSEHSEEFDWTSAFHRVAHRYHQLSIGTPSSIERYSLAQSFVLPAWSRIYPVAPWQRHLHFENKSAPFTYPDTLWTYDDSLLIFPSAGLQSYAVLDLERHCLEKLDIDSETRITRRISLKCKVLIVEWCESEPYHQLNESEKVYKHFATAYDVRWDILTSSWRAIFRNEWKIHFLGMPLNSQNRFFSTHNDTHYAMYLWQPNRSAWGETEPLESLVVWDISSASTYRPSQDPSGEKKDTMLQEGAKLVKRWSFTDLDFYCIRQRDTPNLQCLKLDPHHVYIIEENHRWMRGNQADSTLPRLHEVKSTGIPFYDGPHWEHRCSLDGDSGMSFCQKSSKIRAPYLAPCWRHEEYPYLTIDEVHGAGVTFSARQCFMLEAIQVTIQPRTDLEAQDVILQDDVLPELLAKGKLCGNERWLIGENARKEVVVLHFDQNPIHIRKDSVAQR